jgi:hypothetical protein
MIIENARNYFLGKGAKRYNCAQSVIKAYADAFGSPSGHEAHATSAAGKAPGGYCGALYAALCILKEKGSPKTKECENFFRRNFGALTCKEIKSVSKASCVSCVEKAAEFLEKESFDK